MRRKAGNGAEERGDLTESLSNVFSLEALLTCVDQILSNGTVLCTVVHLVSLAPPPHKC